MFARKLRPDEYWQARRIMAVAFEGVFEQEKELEKSKTDKEDPKEDLYGAFLTENGPLAGSIVINNKTSRFDGRTVKMGGVGGVATLPPQRRGGAIRACMELALREMYDKGYALSHLYPFSTAYYRQFGFAPAGQSLRWKVKLADLKRLPNAGGSVTQLFPGDDLSPLLEIYNKMYGDTNFSCLREAFDKDLEGDKPLLNKRWIYLWSDDSGTPCGFIVCSRMGGSLICYPNFGAPNAFIFTGTTALIGLLNFVHTSFIANFEDIQFSVPAHMDLTALLPELSSIEYAPALNGMARAVNAEMLLRLCRCKGEGSLVIRVTDDILPENNDTFELTFGHDFDNRVERTSKSPDITLDVGNLAVLLGGARDTASLELSPDILLENPWAFYDRVFYRKPCHVLDLF